MPVGLDLFSDAGNLVCADALNEPGDAWVQVPALAPGQSTTVTKSVAVPGGLFTLLAVVNGFAEVSEPSTGNNCCTHGYEVTDRPDFTIPSFYYSMQGSLPLFEGVIRNDGFKSVDPDQLYKLCLYYDRTDQPSPCETPDVEAGEGAVLEFSQGLAVGGEQLFSMYGPPLPNGVYSVWARADCDCQILEADEKNNDAKEEVILDVPGPDLQVKIFEGAQVQGAKGNAVGYMVVVTNAGSEPVTDSFDLDLFFNAAELPTKDNASAVTRCLLPERRGLGPTRWHSRWNLCLLGRPGPLLHVAGNQ